MDDEKNDASHALSFDANTGHFSPDLTHMDKTKKAEPNSDF
jgi:hypothetical protein